MEPTWNKIRAFSLSAGGELSGVPRGQRGRPLRPQSDGTRAAEGVPRHAVILEPH